MGLSDVSTFLLLTLPCVYNIVAIKVKAQRDFPARLGQEGRDPAPLFNVLGLLLTFLSYQLRRGKTPNPNNMIHSNSVKIGTVLLPPLSPPLVAVG